MSDPRPALGFLFDAVTSAWEETSLREYARDNRLRIAHLLVVPSTAIDPMLQLITAAHTHAVKVVVTPTQDHLDGKERAVTEQWELHVVDGPDVYPLRHRWASRLPRTPDIQLP